MADQAPGRLRWLCRRGMKELDLLLLCWLDERWPAADSPRRLAFQRLLDESDPQIAAWLIGGLRPADAALTGLIDDIVRAGR